jgi:Carbohydrate binding domain (family 11)
MALLAMLLLGISTASAAEEQASSKELMVADFDSGRKPNNIGGDFGCWIKDPTDPAQGCIEAFDGANRFGSKGHALRIIYSVDSTKPAFGGLWMRLQNIDVTKFDRLSFRVKGDAGMGYTSVFKVELKDAMDVSSHTYVRGVTDQWRDVTVALKDFDGMANPKKLKEFVIVIEDTTATAKQGVLYLDDVRFMRSAPSS